MSAKEVTLVINGTAKKVQCQEQETLVTVLRRIGLTGTKVGCGKGQCGACSVILDAKLVRSCVVKMSSLSDGAQVTTIEGLGTKDNLHPLQLAWMVYGGVQCGFCSPGFIVSAKALLDQNINPTRDDVRAWFQKNRNACRCTGYKPLIDAVMAAAKVMRGEMTKKELEFKIPADGKIYNTRYPRPVALDKVLGICEYGDDIAVKRCENFLHLAVVQPNLSHANIKSIDFSEAEKMPGVVRVITSKDVKGINRITLPVSSPFSKANGFERPIIMDKKVFRYGDVVAMVAAETREQARAAAKMVKVEYEPLPEYLDILDAIADDAIEIHPGIPNLYLESPSFKGGDVTQAIEKSAYSVEGSFHSTRQPHLVIEPDVAQAFVDADGVLTINCKALFLHLIIGTISAGIGHPKEKIRVIENPTGASFGYTMSPAMPALVAAATLATGRPVSLTMSYEEHQHFSGKRSASYSNAKIACDKEGKLTALEYEILFDKGAYTELAHVTVEKGLRFLGAPYFIPNIQGLAKTGTSNHAFSTAYRGYGSPETYTNSEQLIDMLAEKAGIDPLEMRYKNVYREGDTSNDGHTFRVNPLPEIIDKIRPRYKKALEDAKKFSTPEKKRGVGLASGHYNVAPGVGDYASMALELNPDGSVTHFNTWEDQGQGGDIGTLVHTHEALRPLGLHPDQIHLVMNDTATCPMSGPAGGSRLHYMVGNATLHGAKQLMDAMRKPDGTFRTHAEMVKEGIPTKYKGEHHTGSYTKAMDPNTGQGDPAAEYTYAMFLCEVEVDTATGKTEVLGMHCVADVGVVGNYLAVDGQAYGGMMHCIGFALREDYSDVKKHTNLIPSGFSFAEDIPDGTNFTVEYIETPRPTGPQGSSGCAELFQSSGHVAVLNAIYNACGARIHDLPARPEKVKAAMEAKAKGQNIAPKKRNLGGDLHEKLAHFKANPVPFEAK